NDRLIWSKQALGEYTVKTGYQIAYDMKHGNEVESESNNNAQRGLWKWLWNPRLPRKVGHFGWKCCKGILPVNKNEERRVPQVQRRCNICQEVEETIMHAIFKFSWAESGKIADCL
ncbi:zf-RVT domain-containing protein, partial [Cephalotus follicularis]